MSNEQNNPAPGKERPPGVGVPKAAEANTLVKYNLSAKERKYNRDHAKQFRLLRGFVIRNTISVYCDRCDRFHTHGWDSTCDSRTGPRKEKEPMALNHRPFHKSYKNKFNRLLYRAVNLVKLKLFQPLKLESQPKLERHSSNLIGPDDNKIPAQVIYG